MGCRRAPGLAAALAAAALAGCATAPPPPPPATTAPARGVVHVVRRGETLWRIAHTYGVPLDVLARANGIDDPTRIETGRRLFIPGATRVLEVPPPPGAPAPAAPPAAPAAGSALVPEAQAWRWPALGPVSSGYGDPRRAARRHAGVDILVPRGTRVRATRSGVVAFAGTKTGYGRTVIVDHGDGSTSLYAHNERLLVRAGQRVAGGEVIAISGATGRVTAPHVHFEIHIRGRAVDPLVLLPAE